MSVLVGNADDGLSHDVAYINQCDQSIRCLIEYAKIISYAVLKAENEDSDFTNEERNMRTSLTEFLFICRFTNAMKDFLKNCYSNAATTVP